MLRKVAVELGDHRRAQGLQPYPADARNDVVIDVVAVSGERLGVHGCGVRCPLEGGSLARCRCRCRCRAPARAAAAMRPAPHLPAGGPRRHAPR